MQSYLKGTTGYGSIALRWNDLGVFNTRGRPWQDQTVRWYFDSGFAAGLLVTHRPTVKCGDPGKCQKPEHYDHRPAEHEAIWSGEEWDAYHHMRANRRRTPRRSLAPAYPLSGLIRCGVCGSFPTNDNSKGACYGYRCAAVARHGVKHAPVWSRRVHAEAQVLEWLQTVRREIDDIVAGRVVIPAPRTAPDTEQSRRALERKVAKLTASLDRAAEAYALGDIPRDSYLRTRDKLSAQRDDLQNKLAALPQPDASPPSPLPHQEVITGLIDEWDTISVSGKRATLATIVRRVELHPKQVVRVVPVWAPADEPA
jgi:hypothetical protein